MLFPGMVTVEAGVIVKSPLAFVPDQNVPPRLALSKVRNLGPLAPFQVTRTVEMVTGSCGFWIVMLIVEPSMVRLPAIIWLHPGTTVGVEVGVEVNVGVAVVVGVRVGVLVLVAVGVLVGEGRGV